MLFLEVIINNQRFWFLSSSEGSKNSEIFPPISQKYSPAGIVVKWKSLHWWSHEQFQHCRNYKTSLGKSLFYCFAANLKRIACISVRTLQVTLSSELQGVYNSQNWNRFSLPPLPLIKSVFYPWYNRIVLFYCASLNLGLQKKNENIKLR